MYEKFARKTLMKLTAEEERNFMVALNRLTEDHNHQIALTTFNKEIKILIEPNTVILPEFQLLIERVSAVSIKFNYQNMKNYPPYSTIVQILWPLITNTVMKALIVLSLLSFLNVLKHI
jgi:hypothetical protein